MKYIIWLDDLRDPKEYGYPDAIWFKTSQDLLASKYLDDSVKLYRYVDEWHFDNDLGEESLGDGYSCFVELERLIFTGKMLVVKPQIFVHTSNPSAAKKFMAAKDIFSEKYNIEIKRVNL